MTLPSWMFLALPPILGAVIGLFTNWLAIKMLFRPLAERRILGLRLPFTPGILPRERERIARSLGDTVAVDLLDEATVASRLSSPAFKEALAKTAVGVGRDILASTPASLGVGVDPGLVQLAREAAFESLAAVASSETFARSVDAGARAGLSSLTAVSVAELVPREALESLATAVARPESAARIGASMADATLGALKEAADEGRSASSFLDASRAAAFASRVVDDAFPALSRELEAFLSDRAVVAVMEKAGARIIRRALDRFSAVQRFFIGLGQYDKAILDNMPATMADFREAIGTILAEPATRTAFSERVGKAVAAFAERPLSELGFLREPEALARARETLGEAYAAVIASLPAERVSKAAYGLALGATFGDIVAGFPGLDERLGSALVRWAAGLLGKAEAETDSAACFPALGPARPEPVGKAAASFLAAFAEAFRAGAEGVPLGKTVALDERGLERLAEAASAALSSLAVAESPAILRSIDIRSLVIEKIDSLDMLEMERMILKVVDKELGAITMFGGVLGAVIGAMQTLFFLVR